MKKLFALMLALAMMLTVVCAFAENGGGEGGEGQGTEPASTSTASTPSITINTTSDAGEAATDTTAYKWYLILEADIGTDPDSNGANQTGGAVSYHVSNQNRATALENTNIFKVTRVGQSNRWYVELKDPDISGAEVAAAIAAIPNLGTLFETGTFNQTQVAGSATSGTVAPGYYYIESTAGKNVALQTLTAVTIDEKNEFPTVEKTVDASDVNAQIGDEITFTITVKIPATANDVIVLKDTMTPGLSYKSIDSMKMGGVNGTDVAASNYEVAATETGFNLTLPKALVESAAAQADSGTKITELVIVCLATLDGDAKTENPEKNSVVLEYGTHYTTKPKEAEVKTYDFLFKKVDGVTGDELAGAEFHFLLDGEAMDLVEVTAGEVYRIAAPGETGTTQTITTTGVPIRIYGLDTDVNAYALQETKAPTGGYNILKAPVEVKPKNNAFETMEVKNNEGAVLPSTGGSGTMIFYVVGGLLIIGAAVVLVARRKAHE